MKFSNLKFFVVAILMGLFFTHVSGQVPDSIDLASLTEQDIPRYGSDSIACGNNFSLYREDYRSYQRQLEMGNNESAEEYMLNAIPAWRYVFNNCPVLSQNIYRDGVRIMEYLYENADDSDKPAYADSLMMIYNQRLVMYGHLEGAGSILGRKANAHMNYKRGNEEETFELFELAYKHTEEGEYEAPILFYHLLSAVNLFRTGKAEKEVIIQTYDKVSRIFRQEINKGGEGASAFETLEPRIERLFEPFPNCEDWINLYEPQFEETPDDPELLRLISDRLDSRGCTDSDLYFNATERLHAIDPSAQSAFLMGRMAMQREKYDDAINYLDEATRLLEDSGQINQAFYLKARVHFDQNNYQSARTSALNALRYNPNDGRPYMLIGHLYANSAGRCPGDDEVEKRAIYWAAADKYAQARDTDPQVAEEAQERLQRMRQQFPSQQDLFFADINPGATYRVGCWINETTTARKR